MGKFLIPLVLLIIGVGGGVGAGLFLKPEPEPEPVAEIECPEPHMDMDMEEPIAEPMAETDPDEPAAGRDYARLNNQFVVPVVEEERVAALVVMSLSVEVDTGENQTIFSHEPKLRDAFLQVLFDHANSGGFSGSFTSTTNMRSLRDGLRESAQRVVGDIAHDVLIVEIVRQDV